MNKKFYTIITMLLFVIGAMAGPISENEALAIARKFNNNSAMRKAPAKNQTLKLAAATKGYYAFNCGENNGFIIVAADDNAVTEVLGYADNGTFDANNMPDNMKWWLNEYTRQIEYATANTITSKAKTQTISVEREDIAPLLTCNFNQGAPYNNMCPTFGSERCVTGCVATAMAQIMCYHKYPNVGTGENGYSWNGENLHVDFSKSTYDWNAISDPSNSQHNVAIAKLMYDICISVNMDFGIGVSGASSTNVPNALSSKFGYDKSAVCYLRDYYNTQEWDDMIYNALAKKHPVYYDGVAYDGGHAFVCDGYDKSTGLYHINWGWGGLSNGYFALSALDPDQQGIGGSASEFGFKFDQGAITDIFPDEGGNYTPLMYSTAPFTAGTYDNDIGYKEFNDGDNVTYDFICFYCSAINFGAVPQNFNLKLKFTTANNNISYYDITSGYFDVYSGMNFFIVLHTSSGDIPKANGTYLINLTYKNADSSTAPVYDIRHDPTISDGKVVMTVTDGNYVFSSYKKTRNIPGMGYASFSAYSNVTVPEGVDVYKAKVYGDYIVLTKVDTDIIPANTGVILYCPEEGEKTFVTTVENPTADFSDNELIPTSIAQTVPSEGTYYALKANAPEFAILQNGTVLSPNKAYIFAPESSAKHLTLAFDNELAGITSVGYNEADNNAYYTLQGVKVISPSKGVYIKNGKKVLIK